MSTEDEISFDLIDKTLIQATHTNPFIADLINNRADDDAICATSTRSFLSGLRGTNCIA